MTISSVDFAASARAAEAMLKDWQAMHDINPRIERAAPINRDPSRCPWVGVYPTRSLFPQRTLGLGGGYRGQENEIIVICQASHPNDPAACQDRLGLLVQSAVDALLSDPTLKGTVLTLGDFEVVLDSYEKVDDTILQSATVRAVGLTTVSGG